MIESHGNSSQTPDELTSTTEEHGLIILGNSGVGKSFLANILVGHEAFAHAFSSSSVTHETECASAKIDHSTITIFNIPGLIESEQERIDSNKKEIDKAFAQRPISMVIFMFGHQNGRIRDEDVATFNAINTAYPFQPESLVIVVNGLSSDRADTYEGFTLALLQRLLKGIDITNDNTCFLDSINRNDTDAIQLLKEQVFKALKSRKPMPHKKVQEIETRMDQLKNEQRRIRDEQIKFDAEREKFIKRTEESQEFIQEATAEHEREKEFYHQIAERQQENIEEQRRARDEEQESFELKLRKLRMEVAQAKYAYEQVRNDRTATPQAIGHAKSIYDLMKETLTKFIFKTLNRFFSL